MIRLENLTKYYRTRSGPSLVLNDINFTIERGEKVGILGRNGAGKSTLVRLIGGAEQPSSGRVTREMSVSWPLAFSGAFQYSLTGFDNLKFICRLYDTDPLEALDFVQDFSELGRYIYEPMRTYSAGMRARLAFGISMVVEFDCFLIDEVTAVGDERFREKCEIELYQKRAERAMILVSHSAEYVRSHCTRAAVLIEGHLYSFDEVDQAYEFYMAHRMQ